MHQTIQSIADVATLFFQPCTKHCKLGCRLKYSRSEYCPNEKEVDDAAAPASITTADELKTAPLPLLTNSDLDLDLRK